MKLFASFSSIFTKKEEEQSPCVFTGNDLVLLAEFEYVLKSNPTVVRDLMGMCIDALEKSPAVAKDLGQALAIWLGDATGDAGDPLGEVLISLSARLHYALLYMSPVPYTPP